MYTEKNDKLKKILAAAIYLLLSTSVEAACVQTGGKCNSDTDCMIGHCSNPSMGGGGDVCNGNSPSRSNIGGNCSTDNDCCVGHCQGGEAGGQRTCQGS